MIAVSTLTTAVMANQNEIKGREQAKINRQQAKEDAAAAEAFANTEGKAFGALGQVSLEVDDPVIDGKINSSANSPTISI